LERGIDNYILSYKQDFTFYIGRDDKYYGFIFKDSYALDIEATLIGLTNNCPRGFEIAEVDSSYMILRDTSDIGLTDRCVRVYSGYAVFKVGDEKLCVIVPHLLGKDSASMLSHNNQVKTLNEVVEGG